MGQAVKDFTAMETEDYVFEVIIEPDSGGHFHAYCPVLKGCHTWGHTESDAYEYIKDAVKLYLEDLIADGEPIPGIGVVKSINPFIRIREMAKKAIA